MFAKLRDVAQINSGKKEKIQTQIKSQIIKKKEKRKKCMRFSRFDEDIRCSFLFAILSLCLPAIDLTHGLKMK